MADGESGLNPQRKYPFEFHLDPYYPSHGQGSSLCAVPPPCHLPSPVPQMAPFLSIFPRFSFTLAPSCYMFVRKRYNVVF